MKIDGACLCGAITYEARIDPDKILICHCTDCQVNGGGAFRYGTLVAKEDFKLLSGQLKFFRKTSESGRQRDLAFCGDCGTSFYGTQAEESVTLSLRVSTSRQAKELTPSFQMWHRSAVKWLPDIGTINAFDEQPKLA